MYQQYAKSLSLCVMIGDAAYSGYEPKSAVILASTDPSATHKSESGIDSEICEIVGGGVSGLHCL